MDSTDLDVLHAALEWLDDGQRVVLATVVQTWGSSPRPPGAWMAVRADGAIAGSVSGGCIEQDLIERVRAAPGAQAVPEILTYGVTPAEAARFGLPCGGTVRLIVEHAPEAMVLKQMAEKLARREVFARRLDVRTGHAGLESALREARLSFDGVQLRTIHGPRWRLLLIGAGQVSQYLARMAMALDYEIIVCDPREEYNRTWDIAGARLLTGMPDDAVLSLGLDSRSAVVALTHDPKLDDLALIDALSSAAFYVGCLGSQASTSKRKQRLREHFDLSEGMLARLQAPVGLPIGSHTPPEIAVSILAELIAVRNNVEPRQGQGTAGREMPTESSCARTHEAAR